MPSDNKKRAIRLFRDPDGSQSFVRGTTGEDKLRMDKQANSVLFRHTTSKALLKRPLAERNKIARMMGAAAGSAFIGNLTYSLELTRWRRYFSKGKNKRVGPQ